MAILGYHVRSQCYTGLLNEAGSRLVFGDACKRKWSSRVQTNGRHAWQQQGDSSTTPDASIQTRDIVVSSRFSKTAASRIALFGITVPPCGNSIPPCGNSIVNSHDLRVHSSGAFP